MMKHANSIQKAKKDINDLLVSIIEDKSERQEKMEKSLKSEI